VNWPKSSVRRTDQIDQVPDTPTKAIQLPNDEGIALAQHFQGLGEPWSFGSDSTQLILEDLLIACLSQCLWLKDEVLVLRRNARVAEQYVFAPCPNVGSDSTPVSDAVWLSDFGSTILRSAVGLQ
jgi:hypothetical protein